MPHTVVLSGQTSVRRISALHAKHFISALGPPFADAYEANIAPQRGGSLPLWIVARKVLGGLVPIRAQ